MACGTNFKRTNYAGRFKSQRVQEEILDYIVDRMDSHDMFRREFSIRGAPKYLVGREVLGIPNIRARLF